MSTSLPDDEDDIPVLTDIVAPELLSAAISNTASLAATTLVKTQRLDVLPADATATDATQTSDHEAWLEEVSLRVQSRVLAGLSMRIEPLVERRLRESLTDLLEQVLAGMTAELKLSASNIIREAVSQAVAAELAELHKEKH